MKRLLLRFSALSLVVVLGLIAIAHAQRSGPVGGSDPAPQDPASQSANESVCRSHDLADASGSDSADSSGSSVRLVSVQDVPAAPGTVPPRSVPSLAQHL